MRPRDDPPVPILTTQPTAEEPAAPYHAVSMRSGEVARFGEPAAPPPEVLLPSGGSDHRSDPSVAGRWASAAFQRRVARAYRQLAPMRSRAALADSYGREAARRLERTRSVERRSVTALQVAYALRWLELGSTGRAAFTWADLLDLPSA